MKELLMHHLNILCKWRTILAGWQLGTRPNTDPECQAVRDHREITLILRAEVSALVMLLVDKGLISLEEWQEAMIEESVKLNEDMEKKFPGARATINGISIDISKAKDWMLKFKP